MMSTTHCRRSNVAIPAHLAVHPSLPAAAAAAPRSARYSYMAFCCLWERGGRGGKGGDTYLVGASMITSQQD